MLKNLLKIIFSSTEDNGTKLKEQKVLTNAVTQADQFEICVSCGAETDIKVATPIEMRVGYICGCGQLCKKCYEHAQLTGNYDFS